MYDGKPFGIQKNGPRQEDFHALYGLAVLLHRLAHQACALNCKKPTEYRVFGIQPVASVENHHICLFSPMHQNSIKLFL
jgi:hypothetical protein